MTDERQRLLKDLAENTDEIARLELDRARLIDAAQSATADDEHDPEGTTIGQEREQVDALLISAHRVHDDLEQALADFDQGRYGICERCGEAIAAERLEVRPQARLCIDCARARPAGQGDRPS